MGPTSTNPPARPPTLCPLRALSLTHSLTHSRTLTSTLDPRPLPATTRLLSLASAALLCTTLNSHHHVQRRYSCTADLCTDRSSSSQPIASLHLLFGQLSLALLAPRYSNHSSPTIADGLLSLYLSLLFSQLALAVREYCYSQGPILSPHNSTLQLASCHHSSSSPLCIRAPNSSSTFRVLPEACRGTLHLLHCLSVLSADLPVSLQPPRLQAVSLVSRRPCRPHELHELHSTSVTVVLALKPGFETRWVGTGLLSVLTACPQACRNNCAVVSHCVARSYQPHTRNDHDQRREHEPVGPHEHAER